LAERIDQDVMPTARDVAAQAPAVSVTRPRRARTVSTDREEQYDIDVRETDYRDIQSTLAGDHEAFARLVRRYQRRVARWMWRFTRDRARCEELVQDVFVEAFFGLAGYRGKAPLEHWLARIATRVGYRFWKGRAKDAGTVSLDGFEHVAAPAEQLGPSAAAEMVHSLLAGLRPAERLVLTLQYLEQCSVKEIARRTGWSKAMVKMRAHRARKKLRRTASGEGFLGRL